MKITEMNLYRVASMSDDHHLKLSLHLTNCESSVTVKSNSQCIIMSSYVFIISCSHNHQLDVIYLENCRAKKSQFQPKLTVYSHVYPFRF